MEFQMTLEQPKQLGKKKENNIIELTLSDFKILL